MKTFEFPYGGSFGKGDTWDSIFEFSLSDADATRLEESARKEPRWRLDEDESIHDIYEMVFRAAYENNIQSLLSDKYMLEELRDDYSNDADEEPTDRMLVEQYMEGTTFHICYPEELQNLEA